MSSGESRSCLWLSAVAVIGLLPNAWMPICALNFQDGEAEGHSNGI